MRKTKETKSQSKGKRAQPVTRRVVRKGRSDDGNAFIRDPGDGPAHTSDDLAEALAEDFLAAATSGNDVLEDDLERPVADEIGGPFVVTGSREELADGVDASNPADADVEALPRTGAELVQQPLDELDDEDLDAEDEVGRSHPRR